VAQPVATNFCLWNIKTIVAQTVFVFRNFQYLCHAFSNNCLGNALSSYAPRIFTANGNLFGALGAVFSK